MKQLGRRSFAAAVAGSLAWPLQAQARDSALPIPASLPQAASQAAVRGEPLVLLISLPGCPYCELVRRHYLLPARRETGLQAWQLNVADGSTPLLGFDGRPTSAAAQAQAWKATFTPTVLFLGPRGETLAEPLVGAAIPDFYGAYLDERLVLARRAVVALR
jgi:thioredoxin-related protein